MSLDAVILFAFCSLLVVIIAERVQKPPRPHRPGDEEDDDDFLPPWLDYDGNPALPPYDFLADDDPVVPAQDDWRDQIPVFFDDGFTSPTEVNPATGLEMIGVTDTGGHFYGFSD